MDNTTNSPNESLQSKIMKQIHDLGDSLERAGEKIEKNGWEKIGQAVYRLGDTIEHLNEKKGIKKESKSVNSDYPAGASKTDSFSTDSTKTDYSSASSKDKDFSKSGANVGSTSSASTKSDTDKGSRAY